MNWICDQNVFQGSHPPRSVDVVQQLHQVSQNINGHEQVITSHLIEKKEQYNSYIITYFNLLCLMQYVYLVY